MLLHTPQMHTQLQQGSSSRYNSSSSSRYNSRMCCSRRQLTARAAAGGFGKSQKKKIGTQGGLVVPDKPFRNTTVEQLQDGATAKIKVKAENGAPAGFPEGIN
jgi:hypothetical protein